MIVRLAVLTQFDGTDPNEKRGDVAQAVDNFCEHLATTLPLTARLDNNLFRSNNCYQEGTDRTFRQYETTLRSLFKAYAGLGNAGINDIKKMASTALMSIGEWLELLSNIGFFEMGLLDVSVAIHAFSSSRLCAPTNQSNEQEIRYRQLFFEDFLEALVRLAYVIA